MQCYMLRVVSLGNNIQRSQTMERLQDENHRGYFKVAHSKDWLLSLIVDIENPSICINPMDMFDSSLVSTEL